MKTLIDYDLKQAMRDKDTTKLNVLRALKTAITNASLQKGNVNEPLTDAETIGIIRKQYSQRQDSVAQFVTAQRLDLIATEEAEMEILKGYLPAEMSEGHLRNIVVDIIAETGASTKKDMGKVIKEAQAKLNGAADNKRISKMVGELLV